MSGKVALITAAGTGVGAAIAVELAAAGYQFCSLADPSGAFKQARKLGGNGMTSPLNKPSDLATWVQARVQEIAKTVRLLPAAVAGKIHG